MRSQEYGNKHNETILLLHGDGLSWWNYPIWSDVLGTAVDLIGYT